MILNLPQLTLQQKLEEFDTWVTSTLGEIKDTLKFQTEINSIVYAIQVLGLQTENFENLENATPDKIAESLISHIIGKSDVEQNTLILGLISVLFMVTGKSDNNCKCQFPVYLKHTHKTETIFKVANRKGKQELSNSKLPRIIDDASVAKITVSLKNFPLEQFKFIGIGT